MVEVACADGKLSLLGVPTSTSTAGGRAAGRRTTRLTPIDAPCASATPAAAVSHSRRRLRSAAAPIRPEREPARGVLAEQRHPAGGGHDRRRRDVALHELQRADLGAGHRHGHGSVGGLRRRGARRARAGEQLGHGAGLPMRHGAGARAAGRSSMDVSRCYAGGLSGPCRATVDGGPGRLGWLQQSHFHARSWRESGFADTWVGPGGFSYGTVRSPLLPPPLGDLRRVGADPPVELGCVAVGSRPPVRHTDEVPVDDQGRAAVGRAGHERGRSFARAQVGARVVAVAVPHGRRHPAEGIGGRRVHRASSSVAVGDCQSTGSSCGDTRQPVT